MKLYALLLCGLLLATTTLNAQDKKDQQQVKAIYDLALTQGQAYENLRYLCKNIGPRLSGSPGAAAAVEYTRQLMQGYGFDTVYLQPVMVPHWVRGPIEQARILNSKRLGQQAVNITALGNAVGTGPGGLVAKVVEVQSMEQLDSLGRQNIEGKIVFFNGRMKATFPQTFTAYGDAVPQRGGGASAAARYGAVGAVVRSMTTRTDLMPHTGALRYALNVPQIPAVAIATQHADLLSELLAEDPNLDFYFETHCQMLPDVLSYNVVGEIRGTTKPNEIIVVGGHLDSWDLAEGAHDDGAGCVQSIEALRLLKALNYRPQRTLRAVMFMNEENGLRGGRKYAQLAELEKGKHIAAIESDRGGFVPRGFSIDAPTDKILKRLQGWASVMAPWDCDDFIKGYGGADIGPLKPLGTTVIGLNPDSQRYFKHHHAPNDVFEAVDERELHLGAAAMAALMYMLDRYGI